MKHNTMILSALQSFFQGVSHTVAELPSMKTIAIAWLCVEAVFYLVFRLYFIPRANERVQPVEYRDFGESFDRYRIMLRILERTEKYAAYWNKPSRGLIASYMRSWFHDKDHVKAPKTKIGALAAAMSIGKKREKSEAERRLSASIKNLSFDNSKDIHKKETLTTNTLKKGDDKNNAESHSGGDGDGMQYVVSLPNDRWTVKGISRANVSEFFAWTMFGRTISEIAADKSLAWQLEELDMCFTLAEERLNIVFPEKMPEEAETHENLRPYLITLEGVNVLHKPLFIYLFFYFVKFVTNVILRNIGFRRVVSQSGLVAWHRPGAVGADEQEPLQPMMFFHGISPGGCYMYLPMLLNGFPGDPRRGLIIVENPSISWVLSWKVLTEQETIHGLQQIVDECLSKDEKFVLTGHSYGTSPLTWVLKDTLLAKRVGHVFLMDPITILLSTPPVIKNFLCAETESEIFAMAATEIFTQYYCRRHFAWYNTELWLEDIPEEIPVSVVLGGKDEIVDGPAIRSHILSFHEENKDRPGCFRLMYWKNARHNACLMLPYKWRKMSKLLLEQEGVAKPDVDKADSKKN